LDDGKLTDSKGFEVNFKNTIIIMTSNIGTKGIIDNKPLGFGSKDRELDSVKDNINKELKGFFKPEFLNRIDEKIIFNPLSIDDIKKISELELNIVLNRIKKKGYDISFEKDVVKLIVEEGYDKDFGARPIKRYITDKIVNVISEKILKREVVQKVKYKLRIKDEKLIISRINVGNKSK
jgi:ATP-dependent Clp protease ATP-binding subunit ClpB